MLKSLRLKKWTSLIVAFALTITLFSPFASVAKAATGDAVDIQILATSDLHGKFMPWDYATDKESLSGSLAQIATVVKAQRQANPNTILVDNGDTIQGNSVQIFLKTLDTQTHPMILAMNEMGYDTWTLGNHEFNYGVPNLEKVMSQFNGTVLGGNVVKPDGTRLAAGYKIVEKGGIKVGIVGMTNPNITKWDAANLEGYQALSPITEARRIVDQIKGQVDVLVGVIHVGQNEEYDTDDGAKVISEAIPEFVAIVAGHEHATLDQVRMADGTVITEPASAGSKISKIEIRLTKGQDGKFTVANKATDVKSSLLSVGNVAPDPDLVAKLQPYHDAALADARTVIGTLTGGDLVPANEAKGIPTAQIQDTSMIDLINEVQMHYTGAKVSAAAAFSTTANIREGNITKAGTSAIYMYDNTLYKLEVTGAQLKKYMEWSASYYNTFADGDLTVSFNPNIRGYNYDMFDGVTYDVDITQAPGSRIKNLKWADGTPVSDTEKFVLAVNNYRANSQLLADAGIFKDEAKPVLLEKDVKGEIGGVRELIAEYIKTVKGGTITNSVNNNWRIIGNNWDAQKRATVVRLLNEDKLTVPVSADGRTPNVRSLTWADVVRTIDVPKADIVSFNDFHGTLKEDLKNKNTGISKFVGYLKKIKSANTIFVSAGDNYQGSAMSNLTFGAPVSEMLKEIGIEASAIGNHEFDWGQNRLEQWEKDGNFEFLAANIYDKSTGKPVTWARPYKIVEKNGIKIALIGIATPETAFKTLPSNVKDLEFKNPAEVVNPIAKSIKDNNEADFIVALTHLGSFQNATTKVVTGEAADLANAALNVDAIISAHTHQTVSGYVNNIPVVQAYYNGRAAAKLAIGYNAEGKLIAVPSVNTIYNRTDLTDDAAAQAIYSKYDDLLKPILGVELGVSTKLYEHDRYKGVSALGQWVSETMRRGAGTQIGITNGGGVRSNMPEGTITMGTMYDIMPFDNTLVKLELKGQDIKNIIEHGIDNQEVGWVQYSGIKVYYDASAPQGQRVSAMRLFDGTKVEMDKYYTVATNDFLADNGDKYDFKVGRNIYNTGIPIRDLLVDEVKAVKTLTIDETSLLINGQDPTVNNETSKVVEAINNAPAKSNVPVDVTANPEVAKEVFEAIEGKDLDVTFINDGIQWTFNGLAIENPMDLDLSLDQPTAEIAAAIDAKVDGYEPLIISFAHDGSLGLKDGAKATVRIKLNAEWLEGKDRNNIYVYYYNPETKKAEKIAGPLTLDADGYVTFQIAHLSDYFVADKDLVKVENLPKTGSVVDFGTFAGLGGASTMLGAAFVIMESKRRKKKSA